MEINLLSNETEQALIGGILTKLGTYLERYESLENPLGIISQREATEHLEVSYPKVSLERNIQQEFKEELL